MRVQLPNGKTGTIPRSSVTAAKKKGWTVIDSPVVAGAKTFGREAALGAFGGLGIAETQTPIKDTLKNMFQAPNITPEMILSNLLGPGYGVGKGLLTSVGEMAHGSGMDPQHPARFGPVDVGEIGHGLGGLATQLLALTGGEKVAEHPEKAAVVKPVVRDLLGVGERDVARQIEKEGAKQAKTVEASAKKVETAKQKYADAVQKHIEKTKEASAKETAAKTRQQALASRQGPVYQRVNQMADEAQAHIGDIQKKVGAAESAKWGEFNKKLENPPVKTGNVADAISNAEEKLPIFKQIMQEVGDDSELKQMLETMHPDVRARVEATMPEAGIPLNTARRFYTKLNQYLNARELPPGVAREGGLVLDQLDHSIAESIAKKGGPEALKQYRDLQAGWSRYRQTFFDKGSPLRKVMEAKDPHTKLNPITSETGARAIDYLGRYRDMGADPSKLGKIRAINKALKELPASGGKTPEAPARPELPKRTQAKTLTPEEARRQMLTSKESFYSRPPSRWELMFPPLLGYKMTLKHLMQNPKFIDWLSKEDSTPVP